MFAGGDGGVGGASNNDTSETVQKPSPAPSVTMAMVASISSENPAPNGIAETSGSGGVTSGNSNDSYVNITNYKEYAYSLLYTCMIHLP